MITLLYRYVTLCGVVHNIFFVWDMVKLGMINVFQNGGECLRAYVSVLLEQVCQWQDGQGMVEY